MEWSGPLFQRSVKHLVGFLTPVVAELGRSERRVAAARYVQGLLMPGQRKSVEPMAQRLSVDTYGDNAEFRAGVRALGLEFFLQVDAAKHKGSSYAVPTELKQTRRHPSPAAPPSQTLAEIAAAIPPEQWQSAHWKRAGGERGATRLAWCEVWLQHALRKAGGELEKLWLVVDWPADAAEPYHYYLAHLHRPPTKARCLTLSRSRWHIEQYFQRAKDDLGFDHFEGRSWTGFHHHLVLSALAYLFILTVHARAKKNFWCDVGTDAARDPALAGEIDRLLLLLRQQI
jgi:SRSO17 transposase